MAYKAGQAFIDVVPSLRGFNNTIKRELAKEVKNLPVNVTPKVDPDKAAQAINDTLDKVKTRGLTLHVDKVDRQSLQQAIGKVDQELAKLRTTEIKVGLDRQSLETARRELQDDLHARPLEFDIDATPEGYEQLRRKIDDLIGPDHPIHFSVQDDQDSLRTFRSELDEIIENARNVRLNLDLDNADSVRRAIAQIDGELDRIRQVEMSINLDEGSLRAMRNELEEELASRPLEFTVNDDVEGYEQLRRKIDDLIREKHQITFEVTDDEESLQRLRQQLDDLINDASAEVQIDLDADSLEASGDRAGGSFAKAFRKRIDTALETLPDAEVGFDFTGAQGQIAALRGRLDALRDVNIGVDVDTASATTELGDIQRELTRLSTSDADIGVRVDAGAAASQLAGVQAMVRDLDGEDVDIHVETHGSGQTTNSIRFLAQEINSVILLAGAIAPAMVPAFGAAAVAAGGLASAVAGVGVGFGALFAAALPAITAVTEAVKAQEQAEKSAATSTGQLATQRISAAYAAEQAANRVADAQRQADRTAVEGARRVEDARRGVAEAQERAADMIAAAERRVEDAARSLTRAQGEQQRAQEELTQAREEAVRALQDMREQTGDLALSEESAEIALIEARRRRAEVEADATSTALDRRKAALAVAEAEDRLSDVRRDQQRHTEDLNEAERKGVEGSDQVVSAQRRLQDASLAVAEANRDSQRAQADLAAAQVEAARVVQTAEQELSDARTAAAQANADAARAVGAALAAQAHQAQLANIQLAQGTAAQRNLAYAMSELTPWQRRLMQGFLGLREAFLAWSRELEPAILPLFIRGMQLLQRILPLLTPIVVAVATALGDLLTAAEQALEDPFWQQFFTFLAATAGPNTEAFGLIIGNLARGFAGLLMAFAPVSQAIVAGLFGMSESFAEWGTTLGENQQFQAFIDYIQDHWPQLRATLAALWAAIVNIIKSMAPLGGPVLDALRGVFGVIASMHPSLLAAIVGGIIGITAGIKAWSVVQAVLNATLKANVVFAIVAALIALGVWLVHTWQTSETFRNVVTGVFEKIGQVTRTIADFINQWVIQPLIAGFKLVGRGTIALKDIVVGAFQAIGRGTQVAWRWFDENVIKPFVDGLQWLGRKAGEIGDGIVNAFKSIPRVLGEIFGTIWDFLKGPLNTVFGFINKWMIGPLNDILGPFDLSVPELPELHSGGYVPGAGEKPYMLLGGEGVLNPDATRALGGKGAIDAMNNDPAAMGGPFGFDWPDWASWDTAKIGLAVGADAASGQLAGEALERGLLAGLEKIINYVRDRLGGIITGPPFADVPVEETMEDYGDAVLRWAEFGHTNIQAPKGVGTFGKPGQPNFQGNFAFPLPKGSFRVGGGINSYPGHNGQDFPAPTGTPVFSPIGGLFNGHNLGNRSYGRYAEVLAGGLRVVMAHLSAFIGNEPRLVNAGDPIGRVGSTGNSTGPHLHLTFEQNGSTVSPRNYLSYDDGGHLMPGLSLAYNGTGAKERILDPAESRAYERGYGERIEVNNYGTPKSLTSEVAFMLETRRQARRPLMRG